MKTLHIISLAVSGIAGLVIGFLWVTTNSTNALTLLGYCFGYFTAFAVAFYNYSYLRGDL
jgi:hypothetical protein